MRYDVELAEALRPLLERLEDENDHTGVQLVISRVFGTPILTQSFTDVAIAQQELGYLLPKHEQSRTVSGRVLTKHMRVSHPEAHAILNHLLFDERG